MFSIEYPALTLPNVRGIIEANTTNTDRHRLQAYVICIKYFSSSLIRKAKTCEINEFKQKN